MPASIDPENAQPDHEGHMGLSFEAVTADEEQWIDDQLNLASEFVGVYAGETTDGSFTLEALDLAFAQYLASETDPSGAEAVILAVGTAFGTVLVENLGFGWVIATDDYGTGLAIRARPGRGDMTIFPTDFVSKRYERREAPFLVASFGEIRHHLQEMAADWGDA
jgi:hypothetical protein